MLDENSLIWVCPYCGYTQAQHVNITMSCRACYAQVTIEELIARVEKAVPCGD